MRLRRTQQTDNFACGAVDTGHMEADCQQCGMETRTDWLSTWVRSFTVTGRGPDRYKSHRRPKDKPFVVVKLIVSDGPTRMRTVVTMGPTTGRASLCRPVHRVYSFSSMFLISLTGLCAVNLPTPLCLQLRLSDISVLARNISLWIKPAASIYPIQGGRSLPSERGKEQSQQVLYLQFLLADSLFIHRVSKQPLKNSFCQNFVKFPPILVIFDRKMANRLKLCEVHSFPTLPKSRHHPC